MQPMRKRSATSSYASRPAVRCSIGGGRIPATGSGARARRSVMTFAQSLRLWKGVLGSIWRLLCCATIISCSIIGATAAAGTKESLLEAHEIALKPGESDRLELGGLGSAGYMWSYEVAGEPDAVAVTIETAAPPAAPPGAPPRS